MNNNGNNIIRVATYARVSTQEQATEGTSLESQDSQLAAFCQLQGWTIINSYVDPGFSGKDGNRPGLERLLSDARIGLFEKVVVYKLDRLARNLRLLLEIESKLRDYHISLTSIKESIDTSTGTGKMVFQMFGMIAEWERETIIERTRDGRLLRYRQGCWAGGKVPYGYYRDPETRKLAIRNDNEVSIIKRIYREYNSGKSLNAIANMLNKEKVPTRCKGGKGWRATAVRHLLINPLYKGTLIVNRHSNISNLNKIDLSKTITIPVPPIITESEWQIAQDRLNGNKHVRPIEPGAFILQGLIICGYCGHSYRTERTNNRRYYECRGRLKSSHPDGSDRCSSPRFRADWLESEVWNRIEDIINDPNKLQPVLVDTIKNLRARAEELSSNERGITNRLEEITVQKRKLADDWVIRNMDSAKFREVQHNLEREESRLRSILSKCDPAQLKELEQTRDTLQFWETQLKSMAWNTEDEREGHMVRLVDKPHQAVLQIVGFENSELTKVKGFPASRRELLDRFQVKLVVYPDRIDVKATFDIRPICYQYVTSPY